MKTREELLELIRSDRINESKLIKGDSFESRKDC